MGFDSFGFREFGLSLPAAPAAGGDEFVAHAVRITGPDTSLRQMIYGGGADTPNYLRVTFLRPDEMYGLQMVVDPDGDYGTYEDFNVTSDPPSFGQSYGSAGNSSYLAGTGNFGGSPVTLDVGQWNLVMRAVSVRSMPPTLAAGPVAMSSDGSGMIACELNETRNYFSGDGGTGWDAIVPGDNLSIQFNDIAWPATGPLRAVGISEADGSGVLSSTDGTSWEKLTTGIEALDTGTTQAVACSSNSQVIAVVASSTTILYLTVDGGSTWGSVLDVGGSSGSLSGVFISADGQYLVALDSANGNVHWSDDQGDTFNEVALPTDFGAGWAKGCASADCQTLYLIFNAPGSGCFAKSTDGGVTWAAQSFDDLSVVFNAFDISCSADGQVVNLIGYGVGDPAVTLRSTDALATGALNEVGSASDFGPSNIAIACSEDGDTVLLKGALLWRSTDGGTAFELVGDYTQIAFRINGTNIDLSNTISSSGAFPFNIAMAGLPVYLFDSGQGDGYSGAVGPDMMWRVTNTEVIGTDGFIKDSVEALFVEGDPTGGGVPKDPAVARAALGTPDWCNNGPAATYADNEFGTAGAWTVVGEPLTDDDASEPIVIGS